MPAPMLAVSSQLEEEEEVVVLHIYIGLIRSSVESRAIDKSSANERNYSSSFQIPSSKIETIFLLFVVVVIILGSGTHEGFRAAGKHFLGPVKPSHNPTDPSPHPRHRPRPPG